MDKLNLIETIDTEERVKPTAWSYDNKYFSVGSFNDNAYIFNVDDIGDNELVTEDAVETIETGGWVTSIDWSYDNKYLAIASFDDNVYIFNVDDIGTGIGTQDAVETIETGGWVRSTDWSYDNEYLAIGSVDNNAYIFNVDDIGNGIGINDSEETIYTNGTVRDIGWSYDNKYFSLASGDEHAYIFYVDDIGKGIGTGNAIETIKKNDEVWSTSWSYNNEYFIIGSRDSNAYIYDVINLPTIKTLPAKNILHNSADLMGELVDLYEFEDTSLGFEYRKQGEKINDRYFNEDPDDVEDGIYADGYWRTDVEPNGYTHEGDYTHDNYPLKEGETRIYYFDEAGSGVDLDWYLRDDFQSGANGTLENELYDGVRYNSPNGLFRVEVTLSSDGDKVTYEVYGEEEGYSLSFNETVDVSGVEDVYFSMYEWSGGSGTNSLRLIGIEDWKLFDFQLIDSIKNTDTPQKFSETVTDLEPKTKYEFFAFSETGDNND